MKRLITLVCMFGFMLGTSFPVLGWGEEGHKTVGRIAALRIKRHTAQRIAQILKPGETLASIAGWADTVKERVGQTDTDPDTNAFLQDIVHNDKNREWHYDDLPLGCLNYQTCTGFTPDNDVVHMINICIRTLQGHPDPEHPLTPRNALRLLVHFVGDMHQPLHIGAGYIDARRARESVIVLATDPAEIKRLNFASDRGGNELIIDHDRKRLHSFWDFDLVTSLMTQTHRQNPDDLGKLLRQTVAVQSSWNPRGPITGWAAQWASDSLNESRNKTYRSIRILDQRTISVLRDNQPVVRNGVPVTEVIYDVSLPMHYEQNNRAVVRTQLAKAGYRLAKLLDAIFQS
jgi:hypothetical protein